MFTFEAYTKLDVHDCTLVVPNGIFWATYSGQPSLPGMNGLASGVSGVRFSTIFIIVGSS